MYKVFVHGFICFNVLHYTLIEIDKLQYIWSIGSFIQHLIILKIRIQNEHFLLLILKYNKVTCTEVFIHGVQGVR